MPRPTESCYGKTQPSRSAKKINKVALRTSGQAGRASFVRVNRRYETRGLPRPLREKIYGTRVYGCFCRVEIWAYNTRRFQKQKRNLRIRRVPWVNLRLIWLDSIKRIVTRR